MELVYEHYPTEQIKDWISVMSYQDFEGDIKSLYRDANFAYLYSFKNEGYAKIPVRGGHTELFFLLIEDVDTIALVDQPSILKYLADNVYFRGRFPRGHDLTKRLFMYVCEKKNVTTEYEDVKLPKAKLDAIKMELMDKHDAKKISELQEELEVKEKENDNEQ